MWWEQTEDGQTFANKIPIRCPVCKTVLEYRFPEDRTWSYCKDCKADFFFPPNKEVPTRSRLDSMKCASNKCGCGRCGN